MSEQNIPNKNILINSNTLEILKNWIKWLSIFYMIGFLLSAACIILFFYSIAFSGGIITAYITPLFLVGSIIFFLPSFKFLKFEQTIKSTLKNPTSQKLEENLLQFNLFFKYLFLSFSILIIISLYLIFLFTFSDKFK